MRDPRVYATASDEYTEQNNYLNNSYPQVGGGCELYAYTEARQTSILGTIII